MKKLYCLIVTAISLIFFTPSNAFSTLYYVDLSATGTGDGLSWANAFNHPQDAMDAALSGDQIWVADGTYTRKSPTDTVVLTMNDGVDIYGGFAGDETDLSQRDYETNVTILDAQGTRESQSRVVIGADNVRLDGFTITGGYLENRDDVGAGMLNIRASPIIENCIFTENRMIDYNGTAGGGMYNSYSSPTIRNCTFSRNEANSGGGMFNSSSSPTITKCTFSGNYAEAGGAMYNVYSSPTITNCIFTGNRSPFDLGGGGGIWNSTNSSPTITNCSFTGNVMPIHNEGNIFITITNSSFVGNHFTAIRTGTGTITNSIFVGNFTRDRYGDFNNQPAISYGSFTIINCTFVGNRDEPMLDPVEPTIGGSNTVINSIFWGNYTSADIGRDATVTYSNVEGGFPGSGNIDADPLFVDFGHWDDNGTPDKVWDDIWVNGDYHLKEGSPSIDTGTDALAPSEDIEGNSRPQGLSFDMGAYEMVFTCTDSDGDGFYEEGGDCGEVDCDDTDALIHPAASEICNDTIDNDCDGFSDCNDNNCSGDAVCTSDSDGSGDTGGSSGGGCSIIGVKLDIKDALAG